MVAALKTADAKVSVGSNPTLSAVSKISLKEIKNGKFL